MAALASILYDLGNEVIGYDDMIDHAYTEGPLQERNILIVHEPIELDPQTIVVSSAAIREEHPEIQRIRALGLQEYPYQEMLGKLTREHHTIAISGTHGKTTITSMLASIFSDASYFIGDGTGKGSQENKYFIIEACEYNRHFLSYQPSVLVVSNIDLEHVECYRDMDDLKDTFTELINKTSDKVIVCGDDFQIKSLKTNKNLIYYGLDETNDIYIKNKVVSEDGVSFDVYIYDAFYDHFTITLFGEHNLLNCLAVIMVSYLEGVPVEVIKERLQHFQGAKRRFKETKFDGIITIDDYAHHPTEIKATIGAVREKYPDQKLIAIFRPNTYSRTQRFYQEFAEALNLADYAYVTPIYDDRERKEEYEGVTSDLILEQLRDGELLLDEDIAKVLEQGNGVYLFMSCKNIYLLKEKMEELIHERRKDRGR